MRNTINRRSFLNLNRRHCCVVGMLLLVTAVPWLDAWGAETAQTGRGLPGPLFAYTVKVPDAMLSELGYAPIHQLLAACNLDEDPPYAPDLKQRIRQLQGTDTIFWLMVLGKRTGDRDADAVRIIRELADVADEAGVRMAIYPHARFYIETAEGALRLVKQVKRKNVGLTVNLCHELMAGNGGRLPRILDEVAPHLFVVTLNGADNKQECEHLSWKQQWDWLIQPLGQGSYDVYAFLKKVQAVGYTGPIGLQCYGLKMDPAVHLKQSMNAWKEYSTRLAAEPSVGR